MRSATYSGQFKKDIKLAKKRGKNMDKLRTVMALLLEGKTLPRELYDHPLKGEWKYSRDLHIESDWVLIYTLYGDAVHFERTGTHSDLFKN